MNGYYGWCPASDNWSGKGFFWSQLAKWAAAPIVLAWLINLAVEDAVWSVIILGVPLLMLAGQIGACCRSWLCFRRARRSWPEVR